MSTIQNTISSKLPDLQTSIFTVMSRLARTHNAINLSQGFPNFDMDQKLIDLVSKAMNEGYNQYAPMAGIYSLREVISEKIKSLYGTKYHPESEITITVGATQAIFTAISACVNKGDEVIVFKPAYDCYEPAILTNGGVPILLQLKGKEYSVDWKEFKNTLTEKTKMVIINTPHNPSGTIFSKTDMLQLQECLRDTNAVLLSDEAYEHLIFDEGTHESAAKYPELAARTFICASFGKTFHSTGWKMGYCAAPKVLMKEFHKIHEFNVFCVNHPTQRALAEYLKDPQHYLQLGSFFQQKRDFFLSAIRESRFKFIPAQGTYFQLLDYSEISNESDIVLAKKLTIEHGLASIPISAFNRDGLDNKQLRFCFAKTDETLERAAKILNDI